MTEPKYKHGCESCVFIPYPSHPGDFYVCPQKGHPTLILRTGNNGEDYQSVPLDVIVQKFFPSEF